MSDDEFKARFAACKARFEASRRQHEAPVIAKHSSGNTQPPAIKQQQPPSRKQKQLPQPHIEKRVDVQSASVPHLPEAEKGVLSSILFSPHEAIAKCVEAGVERRWFFVPAHQTIYQELRDAWDNDESIDLITFTNRLRDKGLLKSIGDVGAVTDVHLYLDEVFNFRPTIENLPHYIGIVRELYVRRELIEVCKSGERLAYNPTSLSDSTPLDVIESRLVSLRSLQGANSALPQIEDAATAINQQITLPSDVIEGILHEGGKLVCGGGSKSFKTWLLIDLAVCKASGTPWLNGYLTTKGRVLYMNLELPKAYCDKRIQTICDEHQIRLEPGMLDVWHLRGYAMRLARIEAPNPIRCLHTDHR